MYRKMVQKYSYKEWKNFVNMSYEDKLIWSKQIILYALKQNKNPSVSLSWGKDSLVMLDLILKFCSKVKVIFANTEIEYPETYKFRNLMLKTYFKNINYYETKPIKTFWECIKLYGYPHLRKTAEQNTNKRTPKCCIYLKERPLRNKQKELNSDLTFIGLQTTESMNRRRLFMRLGAYYYKKTDKINVCLPIAIFNDKNIYRYIKENNIPLNPVYKKMNRTGCMYCSGFKNWRNVMNKYSPTLYKNWIMIKEGQKLINDDCYKNFV